MIVLFFVFFSWCRLLITSLTSSNNFSMETDFTQTCVRCSPIEVIATKILQSWPLVRNINFSKSQWIFPFLCRFFFSSITDILFYRIWIWIPRWVSHRKQELFTLRVHLGSSQVLYGICATHLFSFLCSVFLSFVFVYVMCLVPIFTCAPEWSYLDFSLIIPSHIHFWNQD